MNKRVQKDGKTYSLFKGKFAKVIFRTDHGKLGLEVRRYQDGRRIKKCFSLEQQREANAYAKNIDEQSLDHGQQAYISDDDRLALSYYRKWDIQNRLSGRAIPPLFELVQEACRRYDSRSAASTWEQAAEAYTVERAGNLNPQRKKVVKSVIERFTSTLTSPTITLDDITPEDVQLSLNSMLDADAARATKDSYLTILAAIWQLAIDHKLASFNPAAEARKRLPKAEFEQPTFFSVEDCQKLLSVAWKYPARQEAFFFVVGLLTGIRLAERSRLQFEDFRLDEAAPYINVPTGKAKTRRQRAVYLQGTHSDIIRAFMPQGRDSKALIIPYRGGESNQKSFIHARQQEFAKLAGVKFPRNVLRHTAATYLCAHLESMGKAALILGHSEDILTRHYRALVTKAEADKFFALALPSN